MDIERMRAEQEERRKTMAEESKYHQQVKYGIIKQRLRFTKNS